MTAERLWTPWRMAYIRSGNEGDGKPTCIFCDVAEREPDRAADAERHVLHRGELAFALLNAFPYNPGHLMITPYRHVGAYTDLEPQELAEITDLAGRAIRALEAVSSPHGFNLGMNLGRVAGAGIADHVHLHVVPRWGGDSNFMPVVAQTKVLPELIAETYEALLPHFGAPGD